MSSCPVIAVVGASGAHVGGLVRAILADPARSFAVRAVTHRPDGSGVRRLAAMGAQVVEADIDDAASLERALQGAYGVFGVANHRAQHIAQAARRAAVRHVIWSTLEEARNDVPDFYARGEADTMFRDLPTTLLRTSFLWDHLIQSGIGLRRAPDGGMDFVLPMGTRRLVGIAAADIGPCVLGIFQRCGQFIGHTVCIAGGHLDGAQIAAALCGAIGEPVRYVPTSFAAYARLDFPGAGDLANMLRHRNACNDTYHAERAVDLTRELHPGLQSFEQWLAGHIRRAVPGARDDLTPR